MHIETPCKVDTTGSPKTKHYYYALSTLQLTKIKLKLHIGYNKDFCFCCDAKIEESEKPAAAENQIDDTAYISTVTVQCM